MGIYAVVQFSVADSVNLSLLNSEVFGGLEMRTAADPYVDLVKGATFQVNLDDRHRGLDYCVSDMVAFRIFAKLFALLHEAGARVWYGMDISIDHPEVNLEQVTTALRRVIDDLEVQAKSPEKAPA